MGKQNTMNKDVHKHKPGRIVMGILSAVLIFVLSIGLVGLIIYKSGEMSLKASAASEGPQAEGITDKSELEKVKSAYGELKTKIAKKLKVSLPTLYTFISMHNSQVKTDIRK